MQAGFVGLGAMGTPMVEKLLAAGFDVSTCARSPRTAARARALGVRVAPSIADLAAQVDLLILCVYNDQQVRELALGENGFAKSLKIGASVVIHTTGSPQTARDIAAAVAPRQGRVLDAPVSGGPHDIRAGAITLLVGGDAATLDRCRPALASYGDPILHAGGPGAGQSVKLVNNLLFAAQVDLVTDASQMLDALGLDTRQALEAIGHCSGDSRALRLALRSGGITLLLQSAGPFIDKDRATAAEVAAGLNIDRGRLGG